ncbi:alginate lyase family protein [Adhaeribacter swui]|uniref:Alginate lyase family protein n=1 Tax=Adhaeribacter swui TaxID=2086471 RepID=A0A7G7G2Y9_9BACT|nr:alginate lyase family protein [Adhaeribacter swui]QNF31523.1 alginate lyase family protein [Adhaeribacter swui]
MKNNILYFLYFFALVVSVNLPAVAQLRPNTFVMNGDVLIQNKIKIDAGTPEYLASLKILQSLANPALSKAPYTVVNKTNAGPSGSKNDYVSLAPYWWPNSGTSTGLPYVQKDGQTNPEVNEFKDNTYIRDLSRDIRLLGLSYYFTNNEQYAAKATEFLKVFFLDSATRMNPNLKYGQLIKGDNTVYGTGIVDTEVFPDLLDGVQLLIGSNSWTPENHEALQDWFNQYLTWLLTDEKGKKAKVAPNNIGTIYDLQVVSYALFVGNKTLAKTLIEKQTYNRIESQLTVDGEQTFEVTRTNAWTYCNKNLEGWFNLANCAESAGINLWDYNSASGKSLKKAFAWMVPYSAGIQPWPYQQIGLFKPEYLTPMARVGSAIYKDIDLNVLLASTHQRFISGAYLELLTSRYSE